jgi:heavy metal sensor kinase
MSLSIRRRLTVWIAVALILTLIVVFVTLRFTLRGILASDIDGDLTSDLGQVSAPVAIAGSLERTDLQAIVENGSFIVAIRDLEGRVLAASAGADELTFALEPQEISGVLAGETMQQTLDIRGEPFRVRAARLMVGREVVGIAQVGESASSLEQVTDALQTVLLAVGGVTLLLSLLAGYWLARSALKPIDDVTAVARQIEASDLSRRIGAQGKPEEVQRLADTFDVMLERLGAAFQQQRNFVMDVSHELRTPLTALRGNLDVLLMDPDTDPAVRAQLEPLSMEVGRLIRLTQNLLYLAHVDAGRGLDRRPVEMHDLCLEVCRQAQALRPEVRLRLGNEEQVTLLGDRDLLKQLILNLVDNALKYTPPGGEVTLSLDHEDSWARVVVKDTGAGIPPEELAHIFDRYYRGAGSGGRSGSGAGIGLAIAVWVTEAHGGRIEVTSEIGKGSTFTVRLPIDPGPAEGGTGA